MRNSLLRLSLVLLACRAASTASAQEFFLASDWQNAPASSAALWAGGNASSEGPGTFNDAPSSGNGFFLLESAVGQITPQIAGYSGAAGDLALKATALVSQANTYRFTQAGLSTVTNPAPTWNLVFPGGFDPLHGIIYGANPANPNYSPLLLDQAEYALQALLRVDPANVSAAQSLVLLVEDRSLPQNWCGSEAMTYASESRLLGPGANLAELPAIQLARNYFQSSCAIFSQFLAHPWKAALIEGADPLLSASVTNQVAQILDDYLRNLAQYAQASLVCFQLSNLANFYNPTVQGQAPNQDLLGAIDQTQTEIQTLLLQASPFQSLPVYTSAQASLVKKLSA